MVRTSLFVAAAAAMALPVAVADLRPERRQAESSSSRRHRSSATATASAGSGSGSGAVTSPPAFTGSLPASISSIVATLTPGTRSPEPTYPLPTTFQAGATNTYISGAPPLPSAPTIANYPPLDAPPPRSFQGSEELLAGIDLSGVKDVPLNQGAAGCGEAGNEANLANAGASGNCWWTCGGCTRDTDIVQCPDKNTWGLSYDDGPSPYTPLLLDYLEKNNLKTTFFVVGSRALSRPDMLAYEYMTGHQLSVHTWSHTSLTTQTNEAIALELLWTKKIIHDITGVTPNTMRPPYGDIDDRVRGVSKAVGLTPIIWTSANGGNYDTNDWKIGSGVVSAGEVVSVFDGIIANASTLDHGYIVLAHDLYEQSVKLATEIVLPQALSQSPKQNIVPIITCLKKPLGDSYVETNRNTSDSAPAANGNNENTSSGSGSGSGAGLNMELSKAHMTIVGAVLFGAATLL
ncbi:glycoside hydrolase/deacetylase [Ceraceosorus guamensis]|uniref:chitin deacetylase n=1 Tax=Ceraceosorus guamensis TaxID=1522189 RepID=A0A316W414_9BASI|nr:glycoside hydrolase/deacetylase [Ceraceosorus guamensis]PWN44432.1 glycoside hydrolase/deacetylase [Ceraceosorus guamensis]